MRKHTENESGVRIILVTNLLDGSVEAFTSMPKVIEKYKDFKTRTMGEAFRNGKVYVKGTFKVQRLDVI